MKNKIIATLLLLSLLFQINFAYAQEQYGWVLVSQTDYTGTTDAERYSRSPLYEADVAYLPGDYSIRQTYTGDKLDGVTDSPEKGETATVKAVFEDVPKIIYPNQPVELTLKLSFLERKITNFDIAKSDAIAKAMFCPPQNGPSDGNGGYPDFTDSKSTTWLKSAEANSFATIDEKISPQIGEGKDKEQRGLCTSLSFAGITMGTTYVYEWQTLKKKSGGVFSRSSKVYDVSKDENGDYIDSGVRVSDISGEVYVRRGDNLLGWEFLNLDDVIYEGDIIYTEGDSEVIFGLSDMTTFHMVQDSEIIIKTMSEKESKLKLLGGKILTNVKKMIKDGTLEVEMSQAIAGARGTIFVCETDNKSSNLKVLEGTVEIKDNQGNTQLIEEGEMIDVTENGMSTTSSFEVDSELDEWNIKSKNNIFLFVILILGLLIISGYYFLKNKKNKINN
jgi:hypothetical protein